MFVNKLAVFNSKKLQLVKYLVAIAVTLLTLRMAPNPFYVLASLIELLIIFTISNLLLAWHSGLAKGVNILLLLFYYVEQFSMLFAGNYVSLVMLSNIDSLQALSGRMWLYLLALVVVFVFSSLPIDEIPFKVSVQLCALVLSLTGLISLFQGHQISNTPYYNVYLLAEQKLERLETERKIREKGATAAEKFYKDAIASGVERPATLPEKPNVILIFTEGLSQSIIDDERDLMPTVRTLQHQSLNFVNYYNHTFATYAGLSGQLYSGYQFNNYDVNNLVSIEDVLEANGYQTAFINTEPNNQTFTDYIKNLNYGQVVSKEVEWTVSDKEAYDLLFKTAESMHQKSEPFFLSLYTFGTHLSLDSPHHQFDTGDDANLNKFYNLDQQFKRFIKKFESSDWSDNTIIVFTTDHATYVDDSYQSSFGSNRAVGHLDKIPFFIYHKNGEPLTIEANGRNSLALSPTILDFIDISAENYFLGDSLFVNETGAFSHIFYSEDTMFITEEAVINFMNDESKNRIKEQLEDYFAAKLR